MTLRWAQAFGYRLPDLAWLTLGDLEYLVPDKSDEDHMGPVDSDTAFTL